MSQNGAPLYIALTPIQEKFKKAFLSLLIHIN